MSWLLFIDEPSHLQENFPYGVLAGFAIEDTQIWPLARKLINSQEQYFGHQLFDASGRYVVASGLLSVETFQHAALLPGSGLQRERHGNEFKAEFTVARKTGDMAAFSQAKISYCEFALALAKDYGSIAFAILFPADQINLVFEKRLRKDYAFLFERFFHFLNRTEAAGMGILAMPQKPREGISVSSNSIVDYFLKTTNGRLRSRDIIPAPLYTDGALDVVFQLSEVLSYTSSWAVRLPGMDKPRRPELGKLASLCNSMRFSYQSGNGEKDWSFKFLSDLRPRT